MIHLDHNATSPLRSAVLETMTPWLRRPLNASSIHRAGQLARAALDDSRASLASTLGCSAREIIFTSGGTEADNLAIRGLALAGTRLVTTAVEHPAVRETARALSRSGVEWIELPVDHQGRLDFAAAERAIQPGTSLVSAMWVNNETGIVFDIPRLARLCRERRVPLHVDAVQALGKVEIDLATLPVDLMTLSAHKVGGPVGIGALFIRSHLRLSSQMTGGGQERGIRPGTESVPLVIGFTEAAAQAAREQSSFMARARGFHQRLVDAFGERDGVRVTTRGADHVPSTFHACFRELSGEALVMALDVEGICVASASACASGSTEPSHVLRAMGVEAPWNKGPLRVSFGPETCDAEITALIGALERILGRLPAGTKS